MFGGYDEFVVSVCEEVGFETGVENAFDVEVDCFGGCEEGAEGTGGDVGENFVDDFLGEGGERHGGKYSYFGVVWSRSSGGVGARWDRRSDFNLNWTGYRPSHLMNKDPAQRCEDLFRWSQKHVLERVHNVHSNTLSAI